MPMLLNYFASPITYWSAK